MADKKIAIIGAGPGGLTAALLRPNSVHGGRSVVLRPESQLRYTLAHP